MTSALSPSDADVRAVEGLISRLMARFPDVPADSVRQMVNTTWDQFTGTPIRDFIPVLVERAVREQPSSAQITPRRQRAADRLTQATGRHRRS
jgi:hypothetical protein